MTETLPSPESRKESYLAKAAGMTVEELPTPASREELYLNAIAQGGGGGGTSDFNDLTNRPKYNGTTMTGETDIPASPTVVQTTGTSETDVMSQKATTDMVFKDGDTKAVCIGNGANTRSSAFQGIAIGTNANSSSADRFGTAIGTGATSEGRSSIAMGTSSITHSNSSVAIGLSAEVTGNYSVAIGSYAKTTEDGQFDISTSTQSVGYNGSSYRLLTGLYDGQSAHDAATYGQLNTRLDGLTLLKISQTDYDNLSTYDANTLYVITGA